MKTKQHEGEAQQDQISEESNSLETWIDEASQAILLEGELLWVNMIGIAMRHVKNWRNKGKPDDRTDLDYEIVLKNCEILLSIVDSPDLDERGKSIVQNFLVGHVSKDKDLRELWDMHLSKENYSVFLKLTKNSKRFRGAHSPHVQFIKQKVSEGMTDFQSLWKEFRNLDEKGGFQIDGESLVIEYKDQYEVKYISGIDPISVKKETFRKAVRRTLKKVGTLIGHVQKKFIRLL